MVGSLKPLDSILRGDATRLPLLVRNDINISARGLSMVIIALGIFYGLCMGSFAPISHRAGGWEQTAASAIKVPSLFLLTLIVTFPSLYVFNALVGSRLSFIALLRMLVAGMSVMLALLASFGTIVAFFSFTTESYHFMVPLNVVTFSVAGFMGLNFLLQTLHRLTIAQEFNAQSAQSTETPPPIPTEGSVEVSGEVSAERSPTLSQTLSAGPLSRGPDHLSSSNVRLVFRIWVVVFGLVGAQMSWVLRPFIGHGNHFILFQNRGGNFFESVVEHIVCLMGHR